MHSATRLCRKLNLDARHDHVTTNQDICIFPTNVKWLIDLIYTATPYSTTLSYVVSRDSDSDTFMR